MRPGVLDGVPGVWGYRRKCPRNRVDPVHPTLMRSKNSKGLEVLPAKGHLTLPFFRGRSRLLLGAGCLAVRRTHRGGQTAQAWPVDQSKGQLPLGARDQPTKLVFSDPYKARQAGATHGNQRPCVLHPTWPARAQRSYSLNMWRRL